VDGQQVFVQKPFRDCNGRGVGAAALGGYICDLEKRAHGQQ
jgi:hypothetical protein